MSNIFLVSGDDPNLLSQKVRELATECVGELTSDLVLVKFESKDYETEEGHELSPVVSAAATPPMLEPHRVVEARNLGLFSTEADLGGLYEYLMDPLETTDLILVWEKGLNQTRLPNLPKKLKEAVGAAGGQVVSAGRPRGAKDTKEWFAKQVQLSGLLLSREASELMQDQLGQDLGRLSSVLSALQSAYDPKQNLEATDVRPYLGEAGTQPIWELTSAIAKGNGRAATICLRRILSAGEHPIAILAFLVNHYKRLLRLDGSGLRSQGEVAKALGISQYPAKLALEESRHLGRKKLARIFELLKKADADIKGKSGLDGELIMEILIARIAQQYRL